MANSLVATFLVVVVVAVAAAAPAPAPQRPPRRKRVVDIEPVTILFNEPACCSWGAGVGDAEDPKSPDSRRSSLIVLNADGVACDREACPYNVMVLESVKTTRDPGQEVGGDDGDDDDSSSSSLHEVTSRVRHLVFVDVENLTYVRNLIRRDDEHDAFDDRGFLGRIDDVDLDILILTAAQGTQSYSAMQCRVAPALGSVHATSSQRATSVPADADVTAAARAVAVEPVRPWEGVCRVDLDELDNYYGVFPVVFPLAFYLRDRAALPSVAAATSHGAEEDEARLRPPADLRMLQLGLGGGVTNVVLRSLMPPGFLRIDSVETDASVIKAAASMFGSAPGAFATMRNTTYFQAYHAADERADAQTMIRPFVPAALRGGRHQRVPEPDAAESDARLFHMDGRRFLRQHVRHKRARLRAQAVERGSDAAPPLSYVDMATDYDFIFLDAYLSHVMPDQLRKDDSARLVAASLRPYGTAVINMFLPGGNSTWDDVRDAYTRHFRYVCMIAMSDVNHLVVLTNYDRIARVRLDATPATHTQDDNDDVDYLWAAKAAAEAKAKAAKAAGEDADADASVAVADGSQRGVSAYVQQQRVRDLSTLRALMAKPGDGLNQWTGKDGEGQRVEQSYLLAENATRDDILAFVDDYWRVVSLMVDDDGAGGGGSDDGDAVPATCMGEAQKKNRLCARRTLPSLAAKPPVMVRSDEEGGGTANAGSDALASSTSASDAAAAAGDGDEEAEEERRIRALTDQWRRQWTPQRRSTIESVLRLQRKLFVKGWQGCLASKNFIGDAED